MRAVWRKSGGEKREMKKAPSPTYKHKKTSKPQAERDVHTASTSESLMSAVAEPG
jgi:hypothetical protein